MLSSNTEIKILYFQSPAKLGPLRLQAAKLKTEDNEYYLWSPAGVGRHNEQIADIYWQTTHQPATTALLSH